MSRTVGKHPALAAPYGRAGHNPIRRGHIYCSGMCGFKCTFAAYERANKEAVKLCSALGKGWEPEVWENCGWNFKATKGVASVHPQLDGSTIDGNYTVTGHTVFFNSKMQLVQSCKAKVPVDHLIATVQRRLRRLAKAMIADAEALST